MAAKFIELSSDTKSLPTAAMREVIANAEVGDESHGEDPSVNALCMRVAEMLGKEAAVFLPSGTMCNEIAIAVHCRPGDEIICDKSSHLIHFESGGPAALSGVMIHMLQGKGGIYSPTQLSEAVSRPQYSVTPRQRLVWVEQITNMGGGQIWPISTIREISQIAHKAGLLTHMDGARLFNAVVETGVSAKEFAQHFDSTWIDLSKGLGCPVGGVLAGSREFINEAWRFKRRFGGSMRQAGFLAAAGLYALDNNIARLKEDHENAKYLATELAKIPGISVALDLVQTNILFFDVDGTGLSGTEFVATALEAGVRFSTFGLSAVRAVTHISVSRADIEKALKIVKVVLAKEV